MKNNPLVSVIIPTYNRANFISDAINSVLLQSYDNFEIIVIDDGSTDNTKEVLKRYENKIRYFYKQNGGAASARNFGIKKACGKYIAFLDSDDLWLPEKLEKQINVFLNNDKIDIVYTAMSVINEMKEATGDIKPACPAKNLDDLLDGKRFTPTVVVKKSKLLDAGYFDETMKVAEDTDMWIRFARFGVIDFLNEPLALYRKHPNNISYDVKDAYLDHIKIFKKIINDSGFKLPKKIKKKKLAREYYLLAKEQYRAGIYNEAFIFTLRSISTFFLVGLNFVDRSDTLSTKLFKITKPYLALGVYLFKFLSIDRRGKKYNILYYEPSSGFGGSSNALANLANNIDQTRFTPVITIKNYGSQIEKIKNTEILKLQDYKEPAKLSNLQFLIYFITKLLPEAVKIYLIIKKKKISLLHVNTNIISGIPAIIASKIYRIPCICHIRQTRELIKRERVFARWIDKFIVLNTKAYEIYKKNIPEEKICIIYDGIGLDNFRAVQSGSFRRKFNLDSSPVIGLVGRIVRGKGHREFALSAKEVLKIRPDIKFAIVGDAKGEEDSYYKEVKELIERENLEKDIIFTGWRNDIEDVIGSFDILVQPATSPEGLGLTVIEAMALRKPVIATDVPGPSDIVVDGTTGFLVPPGDIKVMSERIIYLLDNPEIAKRMGEAGRKRVEQLFNIQDTVEKIQKLYLQVLSK